MKIINFLLILSLISILLSCNQKDNLVGKWLRYGDEFSGIEIEIKDENGSFKAEITNIKLDIIEPIPFVIGDIKWKGIKKISENKYEYEDLKKNIIPYTDPIRYEGNYFPARLEIVSDSLINTRVFVKGDERYGTETHWKKVY